MSFPRKRESTAQDDGNAPPTGWIPACAGMTALGSSPVFQMTPQSRAGPPCRPRSFVPSWLKRGEEVLPDLKAVIELQQIDLKIAELGERIAAYPARIEALASALRQFIQAHEERKGRLAANQKQRRDLEGEAQLIREKISKHKDQLYQVKTNDQYKAMLKEIEGEERNLGGVEDRILEKMIEAEDLQKQISEAAARLDGEKARVESETREIEAHRECDLQEREALLRSEEHTSELQSLTNLVCRLLLEK